MNIYLRAVWGGSLGLLLELPEWLKNLQTEDGEGLSEFHFKKLLILIYLFVQLFYLF